MASKPFTIFDVNTGVIKRTVTCPSGHVRHQCGPGEFFRSGALDDAKCQVDPYNPFGPPIEKENTEENRRKKDAIDEITILGPVAAVPIAEQIRLLMDYALATADRSTLSKAAAALLDEIDLVVSNQDFAVDKIRQIRKNEGL
jgi:hypothetical protein